MAPPVCAPLEIAPSRSLPRRLRTTTRLCECERELLSLRGRAPRVPPPSVEPYGRAVHALPRLAHAAPAGKQGRPIRDRPYPPRANPLRPRRAKMNGNARACVSVPSFFISLLLARSVLEARFHSRRLALTRGAVAEDTPVYSRATFSPLSLAPALGERKRERENARTFSDPPVRVYCALPRRTLPRNCALP